LWVHSGSSAAAMSGAAGRQDIGGSSYSRAVVAAAARQRRQRRGSGRAAAAVGCVSGSSALAAAAERQRQHGGTRVVLPTGLSSAPRAKNLLCLANAKHGLLRGHNFLEIPRCYQQFFRCQYFAGIRFNWAVGISVGITSLAGTPFFRKRGAGCIKKGAIAPFSPHKGGKCPLFEGKRGSQQKNDTKMYRPRFPSVSVW
jgi:hypothetical protein